MPSFQMHLAVAKTYLQKHPGVVSNEREFFNGNIAPDLTDDKMKTHYSFAPSGIDLIANLKNKIDMTQVYKLPIDNDFQRGVFLHLLTDYIFYNFYFPFSFLQSTTYPEYSVNLYASYNFTNDFLNRTYQIRGGETDYDGQMAHMISALQTDRPQILSAGKNILADTDRLTKFIEFMAGLDLHAIKDAQNIGVVNF